MSDVLEKSLIEWAATRNDEVVFNPRDGYYSFEIVADAYEKGKNELLEKIRKQFVKGLKIAAQAMNEIVSTLQKQNVKILKGFINHSLEETSILLSVDEQTYLSDKFIDSAFSHAAEIHKNYAERNANIHISFIDETKDLNFNLLKMDGFDFMYDFVKGEAINNNE